MKRRGVSRTEQHTTPRTQMAIPVQKFHGEQKGTHSRIRCRPMPEDVQFSGPFTMCRRNGWCKQGNNCTYAHSQEELIAWNDAKAHSHRKPKVWGPVKPPDSQEHVTDPLSKQNYKQKFQGLLHYENKAHIDLLNENCNRKYTVFLYEAGAPQPDWMKEKLDDLRFPRFGYLSGMSGDQIEYATRATNWSGCVTLCDSDNAEVCSADILRENHFHNDERLFIAFDTRNTKKLSSQVCPFPFSLKVCKFQAYVNFQLKNWYFHALRDIVSKISKAMISKIMPDSTTFLPRPSTVDLSKYSDQCSPDQLKALKAITSIPSSGPPVIVSGPFGTGKSYLLAVAASYFFREGGSPARILVCTQQRVSAHTFADTFIKKFHKKGKEKVRMIQTYGFSDHNLKPFCQTPDSFEELIAEIDQSSHQQILAITTCLTARTLGRFVHPRFFTHIFIDEGAQMREPEAIAPLSMADPTHTKIVIAGDQHQIGPAILVLGDLPMNHGLSSSLLERLYKCLSTNAGASSYYANLVTNYRSRKEILSLTGQLFYETKLTISDNDEPPAHPQHPYKHTLVFVCSSVDEEVTKVSENKNTQEAEIVVDTMTDVVKKWSSKMWGQQFHPSTLCVISSSRAQLTAVRQCIKGKGDTGLERVKQIPTFDIQGREFRALFLSTSEPTNSDASTKDPLKSLTDRHVFNTAVTRAQSLVVAVGNPFLLLKMEQHMVKRYGEKGKCWSNYLHRCLENGSIIIDPSLKLSKTKGKKSMSNLQQLIAEQLEVCVNHPILPKNSLSREGSQITPNKVVAIDSTLSKSVTRKESISSQEKPVGHCTSQPVYYQTNAADSKSPRPDPKSNTAMEGTQGITVRLLYTELKKLTEPILLGIGLGIEQHLLDIIKKDNKNDTNGQKTALFSYIAENHKALSVTWGTIANTLDEILEMKDLAQTIREKFHCDTCGAKFENKATPTVTSTPPMPTTSWTSQGPLCQKTWTYFGRLKDLCGKKRLDCKESISEPVKGKGYRCEISVKLQHSARQVFTVVGEIKMKKQDAKHSAAEKAIKELNKKQHQLTEKGNENSGTFEIDILQSLPTTDDVHCQETERNSSSAKHQKKKKRPKSVQKGTNDSPGSPSDQQVPHKDALSVSLKSKQEEKSTMVRECNDSLGSLQDPCEDAVTKNCLDPKATKLEKDIQRDRICKSCLRMFLICVVVLLILPVYLSVYS